MSIRPTPESTPKHSNPVYLNAHTATARAYAHTMDRILVRAVVDQLGHDRPHPLCPLVVVDGIVNTKSDDYYLYKAEKWRGGITFIYAVKPHALDQLLHDGVFIIDGVRPIVEQEIHHVHLDTGPDAWGTVTKNTEYTTQFSVSPDTRLNSRLVQPPPYDAEFEEFPFEKFRDTIVAALDDHSVKRFIEYNDGAGSMLMHAIRGMHSGVPELIEARENASWLPLLMLNLGANPEVTNSFGETPFHSCARVVIKLVSDFGPSPAMQPLKEALDEVYKVVNMLFSIRPRLLNSGEEDESTAMNMIERAMPHDAILRTEIVKTDAFKHAFRQ